MNRRHQAAASGAKQFAAATPCKKDGDLMRYTVNGACVTCAKARSANDYSAMRAAFKAAQAKG